MKCEIKSLYSPDVWEDLKDYIPEKPDDFGILIRMMIGPLNEDGEESFDFVLCTPKWLSQQYTDKEIISLKHYKVVSLYDFDVLSKELNDYVNNIEEENWELIAQKLSRIGYWEFENYRE